MRIRLLALITLLALVLAACGGDDKGQGSGTTGAAATATAGPAEEAGCEKVAAPAAKGEGKLRKPKETLSRGRTYVAKVVTSCGDFEITLDPKQSPKTGGSFRYLAKEKLFDDTTFHRVAKGFVVQGGDPKGDGTGGPGYSVVEAPPKDLAYTRGVVAMAKTGTEPAGTSGSQFFVVTAEDAQLPPDYALLGRITKGMDVVDKIAILPTAPPDDGAPVDPVVIRSITVTP
jgi:peptidyl-prolyl cis-trans isomerase B (cyclophilin B)